MPRFDVTTIGEGQLRLSVPAGRRLEEARQFDVHTSGTEANVSCTLSRLGWSCGWVSALPNTPVGRRVAGEYRSSGLDLSAVRWANDHRLATYYVEYAVPPRATQVYYDRADTCFTQLTLADIDWDYLLDTRLLHLSGLTMALCGNVQAVLVEAAARARAAGVPVSFDMNYRRRLWTPERARAAVAPLVRNVDILFCGRADAELIFGCTPGDPRKMVTQLADHTAAPHIVMSMSHEGLMGWDGAAYTHVPARSVIILDRIGAGDAMVAGVLHGVLQGDFKKGLEYGVLTAALSLSQYGDQPVTNKAELEQLVNAQDGDIVR